MTRSLTVFQYAGSFGLPSASPFCLKLTTWLNMAGIPYASVVLTDPRKAP